MILERVTVDKMALLAGQRESITLSYFRSRPGDVMLQVQMGKVFVITKRGTPIAIITQPEPSAEELGTLLRIRERQLEAKP